MSNKFVSRLKYSLPIAQYPYKRFMIKHKCIFIHIPKNAGSSVLKVMKDRGYRWHAKWFDYFEANPLFFSSYHKFAIVRDPVQRLFSAYNYVLRGGNQSESDLELKQYIEKRSNDFAEFVEHVLDHDFLLFQALFQPQAFYIFDRHYNCKVDTILRYETLDQDWPVFAKKLGLPVLLPWENKAINVQSIEVSYRTKSKIESLYKVDYTLLGY